jgi:hypothetical protein
MRPHLTLPKKTGFSKLELLTAAAMFFVVVGFFVVRFVQGSRINQRTSSSLELANYLQRARLDSIKRSATDITQMAQVKMFNRSLYSVAIDADGDNQLDIPLILSLPEKQALQFNGPFPKTYIFNQLGQTVDEDENRVAPQPITLTNEAGMSEIQFSETGDIVVVPSVKTRS